ncbi:growth factor receptor-bound protein 14 isoform X4 [Macrotis lagotis]|uniref:growth factor receptor-bound protein 14 isoform X4 n=1 Tax=Macrotis lagotis TaxID=92651 RepID=UPI003D6926E9
MTTAPPGGPSAPERAGARGPGPAQVCGAAQGRGDARGPAARPPGLACRAPAPPPEGARLRAADRRKKKDLNVLEMPSIPNPFPELCCSPFTSVFSASLFPKANSRKKQGTPGMETTSTIAINCSSSYTFREVIKVYNEDGTSRALEVPSDITARDVCQLLILKNHYIDDNSWTLIEHLPHIGIERTIEDHELVIEVQSNWGMEEENKLYFRKNYAKYEFFKNPVNFFPEHMVSFATETNGELSQALILQNFLSSSTYPEIHGFLHAKEQGKKSWKKIYFLLRRSGLYYSTKGTSKYGMQLYQNYMHPCPGRSGCSSQNMSPMRSISENSLVAMDFSGHKSRVIENPTEALSVAVEEGLAWRKKGCLRLNTHGSPTASQSSSTNLAIHRAQPWFHHRISRDEAQRLIIQQGLVDGVFLVRDSQSNPKTFVLSLSHGQKIKHFQIIPLEDDGEMFHTLDDGHTRFTDLIQLVEFYQLNKGVLPCKLKHYCSRIAL